jgi:mono/diheme cytochrome c family protein
MRRTLIILVGATTALLVFLAGCDNRSDDRTASIMTGGGEPHRGRTAISAYGCGTCHTVPGVRGADALVGPPLTSMGQRSYIGGVMKNTPTNMIRWIQDPPGVDPMTAMPKLNVSESDARDIASYLYTLK